MDGRGVLVGVAENKYEAILERALSRYAEPNPFCLNKICLNQSY